MVPFQNRSVQIVSSGAKKSRKDYADLHMHTTLSDGSLSVQQIIDLARKKNLSCISITDHDDMDSYRQGLEYARERNIEFIPGVEISAVHDGKDIHILGYFCDVTNLALNMELQEQGRRRQARIKAILKKLAAQGIDISYEKVLSFAKGNTIGRPHVASAMIQEEYVRSFAEAFNLYLSQDGSAYVEKKGLSIEHTIRLIEKAGGIAVLAHPYKSECDHIIENMVQWGLHGIEVYTGNTRGAVQRKYREIAEKYSLVGAGGSDFHTETSTLTLGCCHMPYDVVEQLKTRREKARSEWF